MKGLYFFILSCYNAFKEKIKMYKKKNIFLSLLFVTSLAYGKKDLRPVSKNKSEIKRIKSQGGVLLSKRAGDYISRAENHASRKNYKKAIEILEFHLKRKEAFSKTEIANFLYHLSGFYRQEENIKASTKYIKKALDSKALDYNKHLRVLYLLAQIYIEQENLRKGQKTLNKWFSLSEDPSPQSYVLLAYIHHAKGNLDKALRYVEHGISLTLSPKENWLDFAASVHIQRKAYKKALPYLEKLVALYPNRSKNWRQLSSLYIILDKKKLALTTLDLAFKKGHMQKKPDVLNLTYLFIDQGLPYQSAKLLEEKIKKEVVPKDQKNLSVLSEAFYQAREGKKSLEYLRQAATYAKEFKFFILYGQRLLEEEHFEEAEHVLKKALKMPDAGEILEKVKFHQEKLAEASMQNLDSKHPEKWQAPNTHHLENVYLNLGVSLFYQNKYEQALDYFRRSIEVKDTLLHSYEWIELTEKTMEAEKKKENQDQMKSMSEMS